ncbi:MAG: SHOCT domain-containing protein [Candidatus Limnocylindria bacterium]
MDCNGWMMMGGGAMMMLFPFLFFVLLVALIVALVLWIVRTTARPPTAPQADHEALGVLRRRYAAGEIEEDEYERRRRILSERR